MLKIEANTQAKNIVSGGDSLMKIPPAISFGEICYLQEVKEMNKGEPVFFAKHTPCEVLEEGSCMYKCGAVPFR